MGAAIRAFKDPGLPDNYFRVEVLFLKIGGFDLWNEESWKFNVYTMFILCVVIIFIGALYSYETYVQRNNLDVVFHLLTYVLTYSTGVVKGVLLFKNRKSFRVLLRAIHQPPFKPNPSRGGFEEEQLVRNLVRKTELQFAFYFCIFSVTIISPVSFSVISRLYKEQEAWQLPFLPTCSFFEIRSTPRFELAFVAQFITTSLFSAFLGSSYVLLSVIIAHISVELKILSIYIRRMNERAEILKILDNVNRPLNYYLDIVVRDVMSYHLSILDLVHKIEEICNTMILAIFCATLLILCLSCYVISMGTIKSLFFIQYIFYSAVIIFQVGMYCFWGHEMSHEAQNVAHAIAETNWLDFPLKVKKAMIVMTARSQKPLQITAGKFVPLSMEVFVKILKVSFSYYMVLRQSRDKT